MLICLVRYGGLEVKTKGDRIKWELVIGSKAKGAVFTLWAPHANQVSVAGDFNGWNTETHAMKKFKAGVWLIILNLAPGSYQYRFFVDGVWQNDPENAECVPNPFGACNNVKRVKHQK
jgi:1,4-alpha-glucan branching enzyme